MNSLYDAIVRAARHEKVISHICGTAGAACFGAAYRHHVFVQNGEEYA